MTEAERAERMRDLGKRIISAIPETWIEADIGILMGALGIVVGTFAAITGKPDQFMAQVNACAQGVIDGSLLTPTEKAA